MSQLNLSPNVSYVKLTYWPLYPNICDSISMYPGTSHFISNHLPNCWDIPSKSFDWFSLKATGVLSRNGGAKGVTTLLVVQESVEVGRLSVEVGRLSHYIFGCWTKNRGKPPQIHGILIGFGTIICHHPFWGYISLFLVKHPFGEGSNYPCQVLGLKHVNTPFFGSQVVLAELGKLESRLRNENSTWIMYLKIPMFHPSSS